jgi:hypothetical protein
LNIRREKEKKQAKINEDYRVIEKIKWKRIRKRREIKIERENI